MNIEIIDGGRQISAGPDQSVLDACLSAGIAFPYNCRSGECGECLAKLSSGEVRELPGADPAVFDNEKRSQGFILACLSYPRSDLALSVQLRSQSGPPIREFDTIVTSVRRHSRSIVEIVARADPAVDYRAGQYFDWVLPGIAPDRSFSAANRPGTSRIEFHVRIYPGGGVSQRVDRGELMEGDVLTMRGPFGSAGLSADEYRPAILVAGGTGLAPIKAVLDDAFASGARRSFRFFYGTRQQGDLYHLETLSAWCRDHANFSFVPVLSDEPADSAWTGERGMVTDAVARNVFDAFGAEAFLCGPPPMIDAAIPLLRKLGIDGCDIHYDKFTPVGRGNGPQA